MPDVYPSLVEKEFGTMLHDLFSVRPALAIFAALAAGYAIGAIKIGPLKLGGVAGTLLAALLIGQIGVHINPDLQRFMFTLFIYALGFSVAPEFFASVDRSTWTWTLLVVVEVFLLSPLYLSRHICSSLMLELRAACWPEPRPNRRL